MNPKEALGVWYYIIPIISYSFLLIMLIKLITFDPDKFAEDFVNELFDRVNYPEKYKPKRKGYLFNMGGMYYYLSDIKNDPKLIMRGVKWFYFHGFRTFNRVKKVNRIV